MNALGSTFKAHSAQIGLYHIHLTDLISRQCRWRPWRTTCTCISSFFPIQSEWEVIAGVYAYAVQVIFLTG